jgi:hypothetical protein
MMLPIPALKFVPSQNGMVIFLTSTKISSRLDIGVVRQPIHQNPINTLSASRQYRDTYTLSFGHMW